MSSSKFNPCTLVIFLFVLAIGFIRIVLNSSTELSAVANFSPLGAMAIFGGANFSKRWKAYSFPVLTLLISDLILSFTVFNEYRNGLLYGGWFWTYGAFVLMVLTGRILLKKITVSSVFLSTLTCVLIHWMVTDFGVWLGSTFYPQTFSGYIACLIAAIPFEMNFLAGTLVYAAILFGAFEWMKKRYTVLQTVSL